jgi:TetR/AcrR family transcriptional repressor of nem operon
MVKAQRAAQPMKLTAKGSQTRRRIIVAAAELMFAQGVAGTTTEQVRAAAEVSSSQIYHYFADKQTLVLAVIEYQNETIVGGQEPMLATLDTMDGLRAWADLLVEHQRQLHCHGGCPIGSLGSELAEVDPEARVAVATAFKRWEVGIRGGLRAMHDRGELAAEVNPDALATSLLAGLQGGLLLTQLQRDTAPLRTTLDVSLAYVELLRERSHVDHQAIQAIQAT